MTLVNDKIAESSSETDDLLFSEGQHRASSSQGLRPTKRRRLNGLSHSSPASTAELKSDDYDKDGPSTDGNETDHDAQEQQKSKYLMHVPEYGGPHENTFVTQIDQLNSSDPGKIRGPRWRKKSPTPSPQRRAPSPETMQQALERHVETLGGNFDDFDDDDPALLEALLSSPIEQENGDPVSTVSFSSESGAFTRAPRATQGPFRQTTLFGHVSPRKEIQSSQARAHNWPLANRNGPLTHHKLDYEALTTWVYPTNLGKTRDYQFNIVQRGLYHNLLVALPTGLGKTFIAATIMLNWFRWTKDAQIVFVAPTKPLVAQQIDACFNVAGIPRSQTTMLVGNVQPAIRAEEWQTKRVFFMTPQTLINDLKSGICDPKRIVMLVVDEAHRAKGGYAYVEVVKFLRRFTSSFRVLALTATPGSTVESVQEVINGLDISRVEIRTEQSLDIREYVFSKDIQTVVFENSEEMAMSLELFDKAVRPIMGQLSSQNAYWSKDPTSITQFGLKTASDKWTKTAGKNASQGIKGMVRAIFGVLGKLALPIELLKYHGIGPFYHKLKSFESEALAGSSKYPKQIAMDEHFKKLMNRMNTWINNPDFEGHPKMSHLKTVVLNHFMDAGEGRGTVGAEAPSNTRIMVFTHYRDSAEEISRVLNRHQPMIRAHVFVGQAASNTSEGMDQKTQQEVVNKFKKGTYNVIVATSIGEEGLDIGEIDLIVCYDCSKSPIRMLQRIGRTGRKRAGNVVVLLMKGKEEGDFEKANDNYVKIQALIASGKDFHYHDDRSPRIVPKEIRPTVDKRVVEIPVENTQAELPEPRKRAAKNAKRPAKRFNMPDGVETGFAFLGGGKKSSNARAKKASLEPKVDEKIASLPPVDAVILTAQEELDLERRYAQVAGSEPVQIIYPPRIDAFPEKLAKLGRTAAVKHSATTRRLVAAHKAMRDPERDWTRPTVSNVMQSKEYSLDEAVTKPIQAARKRNHRPERSLTIQPSGTGLPLGAYDDNDSLIEDGLEEGDPFDDDLSQDLVEIPDMHTRREIEVETPFYVSQRSIQDDEDLDEILPDLAALVSGSTKLSGTRKVDNPIFQRRKKALRTVSDDDDDDM